MVNFFPLSIAKPVSSVSQVLQSPRFSGVLLYRTPWEGIVVGSVAELKNDPEFKARSNEDKLGCPVNSRWADIEKAYQERCRNYPGLKELWDAALTKIKVSRMFEVRTLCIRLNSFYREPQRYPTLSNEHPFSRILEKAVDDLAEVQAQRKQDPQNETLQSKEVALTQLINIGKREADPEPVLISAGRILSPKSKTDKLPLASANAYFPCEEKLLELLKLPIQGFDVAELLKQAKKVLDDIAPEELQDGGNRLAIHGVFVPPQFFPASGALLEAKALRQIHYSLSLTENLPLAEREKRLLKFLGLDPQFKTLDVKAIQKAEELLTLVSTVLSSYKNKPGTTSSLQFYPEYQAVLKAQRELQEIGHLRFQEALGAKLSDAEIYQLFSGPLEELHFSQGNIGDCYLLASLYALSRDPDGRDVIRNMIRRRDSQTYEVILFKPDGTLFKEEVSEQKVYNTSSFDRIVAADPAAPAPKVPDRVKGSKGIRILERGYGKAIKPSYGALDQTNLTMIALDTGGDPADALVRLTGWERFHLPAISEISGSRIDCFNDLPTDTLRKTKDFLESLVTDKDQYVLTVVTAPMRPGSGYMDPESRFDRQHAFALELEAVEKIKGVTYLTIVNPHGTRPKRHKISIDDFCKYFQRISGVKKKFPAKENQGGVTPGVK